MLVIICDMATRETLLDVTAQLYAEHGWRGTTTRRIAEAAGVNEVTVFRQFGSKESLLLEAIGHASPQPVAPLPPVPGNLQAEITTWALAHHHSIRARRGLILSCLAESEERPALAPAACEGGRAAFEELVDYLTRARGRRLIGAEESVGPAATMLTNTIFMDAMTRDLMPTRQDDTPEQAIAAYTHVILRSLDAREAA
jgi:AcrR family transcriptional regulator